MTETTVRPATAAEVVALAEKTPHAELLDDDRVTFLVAEQDERVVGFAFGYLLPRRHGNATEMFVYEVEVDEAYRRQGIATQLMLALIDGREEAFVLTEPDNAAANALYESLGGKRSDAVMWEW